MRDCAAWARTSHRISGDAYHRVDDETARGVCICELTEEIGMNVAVDSFVGLYDEPGRDPRGFLSAAYLCRPIDEGSPEPLEEARRVRTVDPHDRPPMGFDHADIVDDAIRMRHTD